MYDILWCYFCIEPKELKARNSYALPVVASSGSRGRSYGLNWSSWGNGGSCLVLLISSPVCVSRKSQIIVCWCGSKVIVCWCGSEVVALWYSGKVIVSWSICWGNLLYWSVCWSYWSNTTLV